MIPFPPAKAAPTTARNHVDPPGLWTSAIATSIAIHLVLGGVFLVPSLTKPQGQQAERKLIPIATLSANREQNETPAPEPTANASREDRAIAPTPSPQRQSISSPKAKKTAAKPVNSPPQPRPRTPQPSRPARQTPPTPTPQLSPSMQGRSPAAPIPSPSSPPRPNPSPSPPSSPPSPPSSPPPGEPPLPTNPSPNPSVPAANPSPASSPSPPSSSNGFTAQILDLQRAWSGDTVTQIARAKQTQQKLDSLNYLTPLDIKLEGEVVIEAVVIIEADGTPTVVQPSAANVIQGNLSPEKAGTLAQQLIEQWTFEPTYMAGQAIPQDYRIRIRLSPLAE